MLQAIAGMLWSKQFFFFDGDNWLDEHKSNLQSGYRAARNLEWYHMLNQDIVSMPDKWEYPWYAAWDLNFHLYDGDNFKIECPTGSGRLMNLFEVAKEISDRLTRIFLRDDKGRRPVYGGTTTFQPDPHWRRLARSIVERLR
jgi:hypothetical protein